jgi:hypothetical protein
MVQLITVSPCADGEDSIVREVTFDSFEDLRKAVAELAGKPAKKKAAKKKPVNEKTRG